MFTYSLPGGGELRIKNSNVAATININNTKEIYVKNCREAIILPAERRRR